ncbi:hypothetical protein [Ferrovibrio sp.]|uniref:hypothetical protein n=1 Tax=Ferrovibrio sp. TaxID=1917215 RepID=UPI002638B7B8|nr:hypothetical protein [Ferrovibrio sp.]
MRRALFLAATLLVLPVLPAAACEQIPIAARVIEGPRFKLVVLSDPMPIPLNAPFAFDIRLCDARMAELPRLVRVDAWMPAHRHGMNYAPSLTKLDWGHYRAEGLLLHMPGEWEFAFDFIALEREEQLSFRFDAQ